MDVMVLLKEFKHSIPALCERKIWIGGGYVRDKLAGLTEFHDYDIVIDEGPADRCAQEFCKYDKLLCENLCPKVKVLAPSGAKQRTATVAKVQIKSANLTCDFSSLPDAADESLSLRLLKDAQTRDFTINAMYYDIDNGEIIDPLGVGRVHLANCILKCPINAKETFLVDPVRILRGARLIAKDPCRKFDQETFETLFDNDVIEALKSKTAIDRIAAETIRLLKLGNYKIGLDVFQGRRDIIEILKQSLNGENTLFWMRRQMLDNYVSEYFHVNDLSENVFFSSEPSK